MVWGKAGSTTLSSAGDTMTISGMTANNSYVYLYHAPANASYNTIINFDNDSGTKYAERKSANGGADSTAVSQTDFNTGDGTNSDGFHFGYICDISGKETLIIDWWNRANTAGAGNAPYRGENVGKFTGTTQFTRIDFDNSSGGSGFATDSNLSVIGSDITPAAAVPAIPSLLPSLQSPSVGGWKEVGRTTLGSAGDTITVSSLPDKRYYMFLNDFTATGGTIAATLRLNNDNSGTVGVSGNYARRRSTNGGSDNTYTDDVNMTLNANTDTNPRFDVGYLANVSSKEKLNITHGVYQNSSGAGTAPTRAEIANKWDNTSDAINRLDVVNVGTGNFNTGSEVVVLGWDPDDTHTTNFWEELANVSWSSGKNISTGTFTPKKYLWLQGWMTKTGTTGGSVYIRAGNGSVDTGSNYSHRYSINGGADGTQTSNSNGWFLDQGSSAGTDQWFFNAFFINNASSEKLGIMHNIWVDDAGAGYAPGRTEHVGKWSNTSNQINIFDINGLTIDDFTGGQIKVWGHD